MLDEIVFARLGADAALAAARLVAVDVDRSALDVAGMADGDGHFFVFDQVFELDFFDAIDDLRAAVVAIGFQHFAQLGDDDGFQFLLAAENFFELLDALANFAEFFEDFVDGELREAVQLQFENGVDLGIGEAFAFGRPIAAPVSATMPYFLRSTLMPSRVRSLPATITRTLLLEKKSCKFSRALARLDDPRMTLITSSILSSAMR